MPLVATRPARCRHRSARPGITLIELLIALAISAFLILGAVRVFGQARAAYRAQNLINQMQENGRYALAAIESDLRMAGFFGQTAQANRIFGARSALEPIGLVQQSSDCGRNWSVRLTQPVEGWNRRWMWSCPPRGAPAIDADSFVVRRASANKATTPLDPNTVYIQTNRTGDGRLFLGAGAPPLRSGYETYPLRVTGYYVSDNSVLDLPGRPMPSLRRKILRGGRLVDEEVMPGVEDMQVQFGVDTNDFGEIGRGSLNQYINPGDPTGSATPRIIAVRVWLRIRAAAPERGFTDRQTYRYADRQFTPSANEALYRRMVVTKTIFLRNSRAEG